LIRRVSSREQLATVRSHASAVIERRSRIAVGGLRGRRGLGSPFWHPHKIRVNIRKPFARCEPTCELADCHPPEPERWRLGEAILTMQLTWDTQQQPTWEP
jgi:hypothetical protein